MARQSSKGPKSSQIGKRRAAARSEGSEYYNEKRQAMLDAAATLFKEKGMNGTSLDEVAQLAGIDRSTLYYYVSNRQELFFEIVGQAMEKMAVDAEALLETPGTPAEKFERLIISQMTAYAENYPHLYVMLQEKVSTVLSGDTPQKERLLELIRRYERVMKTIIADGVADGTFRKDVLPILMTFGALGMNNWTHRWYKPNNLLTGEDVGRAFATMLLEGIRGR